MTDADDRLLNASEHARKISDRVFGHGGVVQQVGAGDWSANLSDAQKLDLAEIMDVTAERVRFTRSHAAELESATSSVHDPDGQLRTNQFGWLPLNRKERYYTGTVLPMLVASDGFAHLGRLLRLCGLSDIETPMSLDGTADIAFLTEYGFAESVFTEADKQAWPDLAEADTPDVVISGPDWLLAIEAKMFHNPNGTSLEAQMRRQAVLVDMWASQRTLDPSRVAHVLLLPERLATRTGALAYPVVTWEKVLSEYDVVGPRYWARVLAVALARHPELESRVATGGKNADALKTGQEIAEAYASANADFDHVGRTGGLRGQALANDVASGDWRTTRYEVRHGPLPGNKNWFTLADFIAATASKQG